jgi:23S rRNA pseudouridine1911/1915/1917 synthase
MLFYYKRAMFPAETQNEPLCFETRVPEASQGQRLDRFLASQFKYFSRSQWQRIIQEKRVYINGIRAEGSQKLLRGATVRYFPPQSQEPEIDRSMRVIYEDADLLLVDKGSPCPTTPTGPYLQNTLQQQVASYLNGEVGVHFWMMHRLDIETSGLVIVAKTERARAEVYRQLERRAIQKTYWCLTWGHTPLINHFQETPIHCSGRGLIRIKGETSFLTGAKDSLTYFTTLRSRASHHLVFCRLYTGRTNQIRVHLAALGHWIVGDKLYFPDEQLALRYAEKRLIPEDAIRLRVPRMLLHAKSLRMIHPINHREVAVEADLPELMKQAIGETLGGIDG